jgi:hypothetical protein
VLSCTNVTSVPGDVLLSVSEDVGSAADVFAEEAEDDDVDISPIAELTGTPSSSLKLRMSLVRVDVIESPYDSRRVDKIIQQGQ